MVREERLSMLPESDTGHVREPQAETGFPTEKPGGDALPGIGLPHIPERLLQPPGRKKRCRSVEVEPSQGVIYEDHCRIRAWV